MEAMKSILSSAPYRPGIDGNVLETCIDSCAECALACSACADACLGEKSVDMLRRCIRLNQDCADICETTARIASRLHDPDMDSLKAQLAACVRICAACGTECQRHAKYHEHCRACAEICRRCEERCSEALSALS